MQHVPGSLLTDEQKLKNAKLKAEIEQIQTDIEAAHDDVQIIDDIGDDDNEES